jgi:hypothetical protein
LKRNDEVSLGKRFILKRFISLAVVYYPFIISVFSYYAITDTANIGKYGMSLVGELLFLPNFVEPLPFCGHLWFMQSLMLCYIAVWLVSRCRWSGLISRLFINPKTSILLFAIVVICGFVYRGTDCVYVFFYLWTYFNAKKINDASINIIYLIICLLIGYGILSSHYEYLFKIGIYIRHIQACVMAILCIKLFMQIFSSIRNVVIITWLSALLMEIYLIHHLFVFDYPWYISLAVTLLLSIVLHVFSQKILSLFKFNNALKSN